MRLVVALGGNAMLRRGERPDLELQRRRMRVAAAALAGLASRHGLVVTHGNGPQLGLLALQAEAGGNGGRLPLDVLGAESEGMIGYLLQQELENALPGREVAALLTEVEVDAGDPAFRQATKPIGPVYSPEEGERLARERGWSTVRDGSGVRRAVASPLPRRIVPLPAIRRLLGAGVIVICGGGGGIPVVAGPAGQRRGVEAVIDKDHTAALLAEGVGADGLLVLTDTPGVYEGFGTPAQRLIRRTTPEGLAAHVLATGSMGPKVEAACRFVARTGAWAAIGALEDAAAIMQGAAGTLISGRLKGEGPWSDCRRASSSW
jgi:carbamate kinase